MNNHVSIRQLTGQYEIEIPGNGIDQTGIDLIQKKLVEWGFGTIPDDRPLPPSKDEFWRWDWKINGKGEYVGALPKRIGKLVYQAKGEKLSAEKLSELGNIGAAHSGCHRKYYFDVVDHIEWEQPDFGQPDNCCYWSCHASAKDMILENGGGAIRFFTSDCYRVSAGFARAWLAPWHDCWIVFNGYGLETLPIARILAAHLSHAYYRRVELTNNGTSTGELWINGKAGYLIGSQESVLRWDFIDLDWDEVESCHCESCGCSVDEDDRYRSPDAEDYCEECYCEYVFHCEGCYEDYWINMQGHETPDGQVRCESCWEDDCFRCKACNKNTWKREGKENENGDYFCKTCYSERYAHCDDCCEDYPIDDMVCRDDGHYCTDCVKNHPEEAEVTTV